MIDTIRKYRNHEITLQDDWHFIATGPEFDGRPHTILFDSYKSTCAEIDKRCDETAKVSALNVKMDIHLLTQDVSRITFTRINRRTGDLSPDHKIFYPNLTAVSTILARRNDLQAQLKELNNLLNKIEIHSSRTYGSLSVENYARKVEELKKEVAEKIILAQSILSGDKPALAVVS